MAEQYQRFVALGDSQTEGLNDGDDTSGVRGWADRFVDNLARTTSPDLTYANLAVRGCRARHVLEVQLPVALALQPDLAVVAVGMNDMLRHDFDLEETVGQVEQTIAALTETGCRVLTMSFPDVALMLPVMAWLRPREVELNRRLLEVATQYGATVLDLFPLALAGDPAMWSHDRIHGSSVGHSTIAAGMAEAMGLPGSDHSWAETAYRPYSTLEVVVRDARWLATFVAPFLYRQLLGRGSGTGRTGKRLELTRVLDDGKDGGNDDGRPTLSGEAAV